MTEPDLAALVEALVFVADEPVTTLSLAAALDRPVPEVEQALADLSERTESSQRGLRLHQVAGGWRLLTADAAAPYVEALLLEGQTARLTQAALETLAVAAYLQPVGRARLSEVRGVSVDGVLRTLVSRGLLQVVDADPQSGAHRYATTPLFLEKMGLNSLDDLPPLGPLMPGHEEAATVEEPSVG